MTPLRPFPPVSTRALSPQPAPLSLQPCSLHQNTPVLSPCARSNPVACAPSHTVAIAFPLVIAACIPIRIYLMPRLFDAETLVYLDGDDDEIAAAQRKKTDRSETDDGRSTGAQEPQCGCEVWSPHL